MLYVMFIFYWNCMIKQRFRSKRITVWTCCCMTVPQAFTSQALHNLMRLYLILLSMISSRQGLSLGAIFNDNCFFIPLLRFDFFPQFTRFKIFLNMYFTWSYFFLLSLILPQIFYLIWNKQFQIAAWYHPHLCYNAVNKRANTNAFFGTVSDAQHI